MLLVSECCEGRVNLKRLLVHVAACNLGLWMRTLTGIGTPRGLQGRFAAVWAFCFTLFPHRFADEASIGRVLRGIPGALPPSISVQEFHQGRIPAKGCAVSQYDFYESQGTETNGFAKEPS